MRTVQPSVLQRILTIGVLLTVCLAVMVWPLAWWLERGAVTVQYVVPFDEAVVEVNRFTYAEDPTGADADIIAIYGSVSGEPERIVFADESRILHPREKPSLALYEKSGDDNPVQVQLVYFVARAVSIGAAAGAFVLVLLRMLLRRRQARAAASAHAETA